MPEIRTFIALNIPENIKDEVRKIQEELRKQDLFSGKLTEIENVHITLKFLGEISENKVEEVQAELRKIKFKPFEAFLTEAGVFSESFVRIIWLALGPREVYELQKDVDKVLENIFPNEHRFMSHITIARVKYVRNKDKLINYLKNIKLPEIRGTISSFSLLKSTLTEQGPIYEVIEEYK